MQYPIHLNLKNMSVVIIGGGSVAYRKCRYFLDIKKDVTVIAKHLIPEFIAHKDQIDIILGSYNKSHITNANIVIIATNNRALNKEIALTSLSHGKLVNVVDDKNLSNFHTPAVVKRGDLLLSVSTSGNSPSLSKKIKEELSLIYDETYEVYIHLLGKGRNEILNSYRDSKVRKEKLSQLLSLSLEELSNLYG